MDKLDPDLEVFEANERRESADEIVTGLKCELERLESRDKTPAVDSMIKARAAELRTARSVLRIAEADYQAATKRRARAVKRAAKVAEELAKREELAAERKRLRDIKRAEVDKARAEAKAAREAARMPEQNGVRRPKPTNICGAIWKLCDDMTTELGSPVPIATLIQASRQNKFDDATVKAQYARWRKFNGITGRIRLS